MVELIIGLRGKVFLLLITLWFLQKLKTGQRFRLRAMITLVVSLSIIGSLVAGSRENRAAEMMSPLGFISAQGISMQVTEAAVEFRQRFDGHAVSYIGNHLWSGFLPSTELRQLSLHNDLSMFLNPVSFANGFATGSTYLAECYLAFGILGVLVASIAIGFALRCLHHAGGNFTGAVIVAVVLPCIMYLPRSGL